MRLPCKECHRLTANSLATLVTRLRVQRSTVAGHVVLWRENYRPAIFDFCNNIGPSRRSLHRSAASAYRGKPTGRLEWRLTTSARLVTPMNNKLAGGTKDRQLVFAYLRPSAIEATWGRSRAPFSLSPTRA